LVIQEVGTMNSLHWRCEMWFDCVERKRCSKLPASATAPRAFAAALSFKASLRAFICTFCMCVCIYVYVCVCRNVCVYACVHVFVHLCIYTHVHVYVYAYFFA